MEMDQTLLESDSSGSDRLVETDEPGPASAVMTEERPSAGEPRLFGATAHKDVTRVLEVRAEEMDSPMSARGIAVRAGARICTARRAASQVIRVTDAVVREMRRHRRSTSSAR